MLNLRLQILGWAKTSPGDSSQWTTLDGGSKTFFRISGFVEKTHQGKGWQSKTICSWCSKVKHVGKS